MGLRFSVLASGSTGNALLVENREVRLLVDAGLSAKKIDQLLAARERDGSRIDGILVTHEHSDHIKGISVFARKYQIPVYANEKTWQELERLLPKSEFIERRVFRTGERLDFGSMTVESFEISHDAAEPVGYRFHSGDQILSLATDTGYVSDKMKALLADSDVLILEANHDVEMLRAGSYPWNVKRRILSDNGHLSNDAAAEALCDMLTGRIRRVYMAHLSRHHNLLDLARLTMSNILQERGFQVGAGGSMNAKGVVLMDTYHDRPTEWDDLLLA